MGKYTKMSQQVLEKVGGLSNITFVERCATRLRIHYASKSKVDVEAIKGIEHVVGVVDKTGQVQIIIGPEVNDAFNDFLEVSGWKPTDDRPTVVEEEPEKKGFMYWVTKFGNFSAAVFMPIVPALITGGLILAIKNLLVNYLGMSNRQRHRKGLPGYLQRRLLHAARLDRLHHGQQAQDGAYHGRVPGRCPRQQLHQRC